ncbi:MAG: hypothetical protein JJ953_11760 [Gracilimonas sp.]|uniref:hypothetical protein n=1 Tax=Gracilimonas sp. TaxID=1974203 RepID=UPI001B1A94BD|nr:hypothetical protein [Gracilimonas sp.]MBO6586774.1 hypothetical protein [Gracilimonas sp.]MBO6615431.1 hypothetical protein [Gracilimonas sp.]
MSDLINAQKEFEELIDQLEKLKNVNQITSENAENAKKIVQQIKEYSTKADSFLDQVNKEYGETEQRVNAAIKALEESIEKSEKVNSETQSLVTQKFSVLDSGLNELKDLEGKTQKNFSKMAEILTTLKEEDKRIQGNQVKTEKNLKNKIEGIADQLSGFKATTNDEFSIHRKEAKVIKAIMILSLVIMIAGFITMSLLIS